MNTLSIKKSQQGFTLIELMIVVAIIGILASIALPAYQTYTKKARFTEIVMAATAPKTAVEICAQTVGALTNCTSGSNGVPVDLTTAGNIKSVVTAANGVITVIPNAINGIVEADTYVMTPALTNGKVTWGTAGSGCLTTSLCN